MANVLELHTLYFMGTLALYACRSSFSNLLIPTLPIRHWRHRYTKPKYLELVYAGGRIAEGQKSVRGVHP